MKSILFSLTCVIAFISLYVISIVLFTYNYEVEVSPVFVYKIISENIAFSWINLETSVDKNLSRIFATIAFLVSVSVAWMGFQETANTRQLMLSIGVFGIIAGFIWLAFDIICKPK